MPLSPLCVAHLLLGMEPALKWGFCTKGQSTGENYFFSFVTVMNWKLLLVKDAENCDQLSSKHWDHI